MKASSLPELAPTTRQWKSPLFLELVAPLCLLRITAADPFLIPTENFALLATVSGQLTRLIWEITEQEVNRQMSRIGYHAGLKTSSLSRYHHTASFPRHHCNHRDVRFCPLLPWTVLLFLYSILLCNSWFLFLFFFLVGAHLGGSIIPSPFLLLWWIKWETTVKGPWIKVMI